MVAATPAAAPESPARLPEDNAGFERLLRSGPSASLPGAVQGDMEAAFGGEDFSGVRVHTGPQAAAASQAVRAEAFTTGHDIYFSGGMDASSSSGRELLAHELTHVVQQRSGSVPSGISDPGDPTEVEAHRVGRAVASSPVPTAVVASLGGVAGNAAVARLAIQRSPAEDLIDDNTSWFDLDEAQLGRTLLDRAGKGQHALVVSVLNELGSTNRDDVALEFCEAASVEQLAALAGAESGRRLLDRLYDELTGGNLAGDEQKQADRIIAVKGQRVDPAQAQKQMLTGKVFPFRPGGITVWDDAPIMAERREGGQIWVKQPVRVKGTAMFKGETATLPDDVFLGGALLPENEIVGVKIYDLGGEIVYRPALFLIQISNQNETQTLTKIAEVAGIGLTLGTGALVGLGVEATMTARVLLWADRAAFVLGTIATVINEHRGEIISRYGASGREFLKYVDYVQSATAIYGFGRVALGMGKIMTGFRTSYRNWRDTVRRVEQELEEHERTVAAKLQQQADEVLDNADKIDDARTPAKPSPEPEPQPQPAAETPATEPAPDKPKPKKTKKKPKTSEDFEDEYGDDPRNELPRKKRISDGNKEELQESGWLRKKLPDVERRREFMDWLKRNHQVGEEHTHLRPGSREADRMLKRFLEESPDPGDFD
ncbi:DUF4157 domain-containing protein [Actinoplanes sp. NPDC051470]|uniref:eCIS core domain-containing protein n=1 Tax=Actinoplanes sp. NPDC051470 TaxID=3157224 RepID=UPI0034218358